MKIASCIRGFEDIAAKEVNGKKITESRVVFSGRIKNFRTVDNICELYNHIIFNNHEDLISEINKYKINKNIRVLCKREGIHNFKSVDITKAASAKLRNIGYKIDFKQYKDTLYIDIINNDCFIGKLIKEKLCKRSYRVKLLPGTINACLAASLLKLIGLKKHNIFLDPMCRDGIFSIEASYITNKVYCFGIDTYAARINAKIGKRKIRFGNYDLDWLTTKFDENSIDKIATFLPSTSKKRKNIRNFYRKFFHNIEHVLKGKLAIVSHKEENLQDHTKLKLIEKREVMQGNAKHIVSIFEKKY